MRPQTLLPAALALAIPALAHPAAAQSNVSFATALPLTVTPSGTGFDAAFFGGAGSVGDSLYYTFNVLAPGFVLAGDEGAAGDGPKAAVSVSLYDQSQAPAFTAPAGQAMAGSLADGTYYLQVTVASIAGGSLAPPPAAPVGRWNAFVEDTPSVGSRIGSGPAAPAVPEAPAGALLLLGLLPVASALGRRAGAGRRPA